MEASKASVRFVRVEGIPKMDDWEYVFRGERVRDGWEVRQRFVAIRKVDDALAFLNAVGAFCWRIKELSFSVFQSTQEYVTKCMLSPQEKWGQYRDLLRGLQRAGCSHFVSISFGRVPRLELHLDAERPVSELFCSVGAIQAIGATLFLDKVLGAEYGVCERPDCPQRFFQITSRHSRKYCTPECAHLMAVRNSRKPKGK
jgi:hypothetical protein